MTPDSPTDPTRPDARQRVLAVVGLLATAALAVIVVVFLVGNAAWVVLGLAGLALSVAGAWWAVTEAETRRLIGVVGLGAGVAAMVGALVAAAGDLSQVLLHLLVTLGLLAVVATTSRAALRPGTAETPAAQNRLGSPPIRPVLICNPKSGGGKVSRFGLVDLAQSLGVESLLLEPGQDLEKLAVRAIGEGADCLGMAGGDGSQALVASIAIEHDLPFVCVSAGTRNHFALDLGLDRDDPRAGLYAFRDAVPRLVDYATVNDRLFVNNVSLGVYATIVQQESYRDAKVETSRALLPKLLGRTDEPFDLQFTTPDGAEVDGAFLIMVSNNPYVLRTSLDISQRRRLDSGRLGIFAVTATTGAQAAQVLTQALAGRRPRGGHAYEFTSEEFEVRSRSGEVYAGVDGEALRLPTPLRFRICPRGLRLLVPEGNIEAALERSRREVHLGDLASIARGRLPASMAATP